MTGQLRQVQEARRPVSFVALLEKFRAGIRSVRPAMRRLRLIMQGARYLHPANAPHAPYAAEHAHADAIGAEFS